MRRAVLLTLYEYNFWANERILSTAASVTDEQFTAPTRFPIGSLRATLVHILGAERVWLNFWKGNPWRPFLSEAECTDLVALCARWRQEEGGLRAYLAALTDEDIERLQTFKTSSGRTTNTAPMWAFMLHLVNHGTQHRSEAAQILTEFGHSPGDIDICWWPALG